MTKTQKICYDNLNERMAECRHLIQCAATCLKDNDFLQCAVRLEEVSKRLQFDEFQMNIFEVVSGT